jgi:diacylglycerol O-acyltransferase / wax synthase
MESPGPVIREQEDRMPDRLNPLDVSFLYMEEPTTAMHVGAVSVFQVPDAGFDYDTLVRLISERIAFVPRYRQRIRRIPGNLANPVWVDDEQFDVTYHVRRSALPRPGNEAQLRELVARIQSRHLDLHRPLWETYLVEGLEGDRFAIITKTHHAMVDGVSAVDIGQVILDVTAEPRESPPDTWRPAPEPSWFELVAGAGADIVHRPTILVGALRGALTDLRASATQVVGATIGVVAAARTAARAAPGSPLNVEIGQQRRYATVATELDDYKLVRKVHGGTVNDVVLAVVAGALRSWLMTRGESVTGQSTVRALVPVSVRAAGDTADLGNRIAAVLVDLPVGEPSPVVRLQQISYSTKAHKESGQWSGAEALVTFSGFAPPTLHALGARLVSSLSRRVFNLVVTNVPGPQFPLYAGGALMVAAYPVVPLAKGQAVSVGLTSYNGGVFYGLNADRDAMPDLDVLAQCIEDALVELVDTVT